MNKTRGSAALAFATTFVGASVLSGIVAMPLAHASELDDIAAKVKANRPATCAPLNYNGALQDAAQRYARSENPVDGQPGDYNGKTLAFLGSGDPEAAATTSAFKKGAGGLITNCDYTDFGVGFIRYEDGQPLGAGSRRGDDLTIDVVTIVFGSPPKAPKPVDVPVTPPQAQTTPCEGSAPVPVGTPCPVKAPPPEEKKPLGPPTIDFNPIFGGVAATITDQSGVASKCTYDSSIVHRNFSLPANGSATVNIVPLVPAGITYDVHVKCDNGTSLDTTTTF